MKLNNDAIFHLNFKRSQLRRFSVHQRHCSQFPRKDARTSYHIKLDGWQVSDRMPRQPPAAHCVVDNTQLYRNSRHIFNLQKF